MLEVRLADLGKCTPTDRSAGRDDHSDQSQCHQHVEGAEPGRTSPSRWARSTSGVTISIAGSRRRERTPLAGGLRVEQALMRARAALIEGV